MKKFISNYSALIIIAVMLILLIPGISHRISNEAGNDNITISLLYNDIANKVMPLNLEKKLDAFKEIGVNTVSVMEEDLNALVSRGEVTCIKFNVLCHKYDDESIGIAEFILEKYPEVNYDSYVVIASRDKAKEKLAKMLPRRFDENDYADIGVYDDLYIYVFHDGRKQLWDFAFGYDEEVIRSLYEKGFNIALVHKVKNYSKFDYLEDIDRIVKEYNVEYLNLKMDSTEYKPDDIREENYKRLAEIINNNNMTLVVTENTDQLSNQKFMGYSYIFGEVMKDGGTNKVLRSYETYDDSQMNGTFYTHRVEQYFNSTIDRNIRFITVTQIVPPMISYDECADYTLKAVQTYKNRIEGAGYRTNSTVNTFSYNANITFNSAICAVIMIMCAVLMYQAVFGKRSLSLNIAAVIFSALAFAATFKMPATLLSLYPTAFCVVMSCMAMTAVLYFVKQKADSLPMPIMIVGTVALLLTVLIIGAVCMGSMLSGINYYVNNDIFRGIKISLIIPILYTAIAYYLMFMKNTVSGIVHDIKKVINADIKVYWVIIGGVIGAVGLYYIIRSGNVNSISGLEHALRNFVTELFPARPRTKEFLIGYPALVLFVYYMKRYNVQLIRWLLAIASAILAASVTNSFCHVFTDFTVIVSRTFNGLTVGIFVATAAYIGNVILIKIFLALKNRFDNQDGEKSNG